MQDDTSRLPSRTEVTTVVPPVSQLLAQYPEMFTSSGTCPVRDVLDRVGDKWSVLVIDLLSERSMRFSELKRTIGLVSQRMLTRTLRALERDGLISRTVHPVVPPRVEYRLTETGYGLASILSLLARWAFDHQGDVHAARAAYDSRDGVTRDHSTRTAPVPSLSEHAVSIG